MFSTLLTVLIRGYQVALSPLMPASCRFHPTCSEYARLAIEAHGAVKGVALGARRVCRCHPWGGFGYDPVPEASRPRRSRQEP